MTEPATLSAPIAAPTRPALRYLGGKWRLAPRVIAHFPPHRVYVEPFGGAASVLLRKPRAYAEIYNDLDGDVAGFFQVLRDPVLAARLAELVALTPFARAEFEAAYLPADDALEAARQMVVRSFMGHGSTATGKRTRTGFRADSNRSHTTPAHDWCSVPPNLVRVSARLQGVVIERRPAAEIIARFDGPDTLHYVDPPYVPSTRSQRKNRGQLECGYAHELSLDDHSALLEQLDAVQGMVVLSGYPSDLYDAKLKGWRRIEMDAMADGARPRVEVLWLNPAACDAHGLFGAAA
jgi:DNA adenine methylase